MDEHWNTEDFVFKADMRNAFNLVSRQAVLDECSVTPSRAAPLGFMVLWSAPDTMAHNGNYYFRGWCATRDPLGPLLFCLMLQKVVSDRC